MLLSLSFSGDGQEEGRWGAAYEAGPALSFPGTACSGPHRVETALPPSGWSPGRTRRPHLSKHYPGPARRLELTVVIAPDGECGTLK